MRLMKFSLVVIAIATSACTYASQEYVGAWLWESTSYPDGSFETPGTMGYSVQLQFSEDGSFLSYRDFDLVEQSTWGISYVWVFIDGWMTHVGFIAIESGSMWEPIEVVPFISLELRNAGGGTELYHYLGPVSSESWSWGGVKALFRE